MIAMLGRRRGHRDNVLRDIRSRWLQRAWLLYHWHSKTFCEPWRGRADEAIKRSGGWGQEIWKGLQRMAPQQWKLLTKVRCTHIHTSWLMEKTGDETLLFCSARWVSFGCWVQRGRGGKGQGKLSTSCLRGTKLAPVFRAFRKYPPSVLYRFYKLYMLVCGNFFHLPGMLLYTCSLRCAELRMLASGQVNGSLLNPEHDMRVRVWILLSFRN